MTEPNQVLGHWRCEQGGTAEVKQTRKRGNHFYTNCDCCGLNQGTGQKRQQRIWDEAKFLTGVTVVRPTNVTIQSGAIASESEKVSEPVGEVQSEAVSDYTPAPSGAPEVVERSGGFNKAKLFGGLVLLAAAGVGAWMN